MTELAAELGLGLPADALAQPARRLRRARLLARAGHGLARQARPGRAAAGAERGRRGARGRWRRLVDHAAEIEPHPGRGPGHAGTPQRDAARRHARGDAACARARRSVLAAGMADLAGHAHGCSRGAGACGRPSARAGGRRRPHARQSRRRARACSWPKPRASPWPRTCHGPRRRSWSSRHAEKRSAPDRICCTCSPNGPRRRSTGIDCASRRSVPIAPAC